jgi:hypothetical protein
LAQFGLTDFTKKNTPGLDSDRSGPSSSETGPTPPSNARETDLKGLPSGARLPAVLAPEGVRGDGDRPIKSRSTAPSRLLPLARTGRAETLALQGRRQSSSRELLRRWRGNEEKRWTTTSPERGGTTDLDAGGGPACRRWRSLLGPFGESSIQRPWVKTKVGLANCG